MIVYACSTGCIHEGGGVNIIVATKDIARQWLERCREIDMKDMRRVNARRAKDRSRFLKDNPDYTGRTPYEPYTMTDIEENGDSIQYVYVHDYRLAHPMEIRESIEGLPEDAFR